MADPDQILQLGIEEARNGNREAARNLFELLTRQEPNNSQGWLWLAGVADGADQRREALEQVLRLDPENEMARKGLQAMGVAPVAASAPVAVSAPVEAAAPAAPRSNDEAFADELDLAFDDTYASIPRAETPRREVEADAGLAGASGEESSRRGPVDRPTLRRPSPRVRTVSDDDDDEEPARRSGPSPLLWAVLGLLVVIVLGWLALQLFFPPAGGTANPPAEPTSAIVPTSAPEGQPTAAPEGQPTAAPEGQPTAAPAEPTAAPAEPTAVPAPPVTPPEQANPAPVAVGTTLQANGWNYTFPNASYAVALGNQVAGQAAQGNFIHVLAWVANTTGTAQALPADFFVLKDSQGRVFSALPQVSSALVNRGVNADIGMEDQIPANGVTTSVYLVFDVPAGATDLTLFARGNPSQGFKVLDRVP